MSDAPTRLRTQHRIDPAELDRPRPVLHWAPPADRPQVAWQLHVVTASAGFAAEPLWDSGRVAGDDHLAVYGGPELAPRCSYRWRVRCWADDGEPSAWSQPVAFATGWLGEPWPARWIGRHCDRPPVAPALRREFDVPADLVEARWYVTGHGALHLRCNGAVVGEEALAPGWSDYRRRLYYRCHEVSALLRPGERNCLAAIVGDGWFRGHIGWQGRDRHYGEDRALLAVLVLRGADGRETVIATDDQWRVGDSHVLVNDMLHGEEQDPAQLPAGWDAPGFDDAGWEPVRTREPDPALLLEAHPAPPVRPVAELAMRECWSPTAGCWVVDLGQNIAGRVRLRLRALRAGAQIRLRHGELVNPDGSLYTANLRGARAEDHYVATGAAEEVFEPLFTFHGFRYVEVTGLAEAPSADDVTGVVLATDQEPVGDFECDRELVNQLERNIRWTWRGNAIEIPTDCPQRDERLGWTGDIAAFVPSATRLDDCTAFLDKWLVDLADTQRADGCVTNVAPHPPGMEFSWPFQMADAGWGDAATVVPWELYRSSGDRELLARHFPLMRGWLAHLEADSEDGLRHPEDGKSFVPGDWLNADAPCSHDLLMTAWFARSADRTRRAAEALGETAEAERCARLFERVASAFRRAFVREDGLVIGPGQEACSQTAQCSALHFGLVDGELAERVFARLVEDIEARGRRLSVGFLGVSYLLPVLSDRGRHDLAETICCNEDYPGWLYSVVNGATTVWERWNGWTVEGGPHEPGMNSFSHYAYGAVHHWLMTRLAGLDLAAPGGARLRIAPQVGGRFRRAEARWTTARGEARSAWHIDGEAIQLTVTVPGGSSAEVLVPSADPTSVELARKPLGTASTTLGPGRWKLRALAPVASQSDVSQHTSL